MISVFWLLLVVLNSIPFRTARISDGMTEKTATGDVGVLYDGKYHVTLDKTRVADSFINAKQTEVSSVQRKQRRSVSSWAIKMGKQAVKELLNGAVWIGRKNGVDFFEKYASDTKAMKQFQDLFPEGIHRSEAGLSRTGLVGNRIITIRKKGDDFPYTFVGISKPNTDIVETVIRYKDIGTSG